RRRLRRRRKRPRSEAARQRKLETHENTKLTKRFSTKDPFRGFRVFVLFVDDLRGMSKLSGSKKATQFTESAIREMTRLNDMYGGVNLSQGFPDFPAPSAIKEAACAAINADVNQYAVTWGARPLREAVAREFSRRYGVPIVADEQVTVCCGSTEAMMSTMMAVVDP